MDKRMRFAMVGAGGIAQSYAQAFEECENARLVAVADVRLENAAALAERFGCPSFGSHEAMASGAKFDAVVICTPPHTHEDIALYFTDRKINVLCEKPFAIDLRSARRMYDAARHAGVKLTMASKFRYVEDVIRAKSIVMSGILGEIILFENAFTARVDMGNRWNSDPKVSGGPLSDVQVVEGKRIQGLQVEDTVRIFVRSLSGVVGNIDLSWSINKELDSYINVYGSQGAISVGWKQSRYRQASSRDWIVFGKGYDKVQAFRSQLNNFARAVRGEEMLLISPEDAVASVEVIEAAYKSLHEEHWTRIGEQPVIRKARPRRALVEMAASVNRRTRA
jgi:predicted dehydrogenase